METIAIIFLTIVVIYLIFQHRHLTREVDDLYCQVEDLQVTCSDYEDRIKDLEYVRDKARSKRRKNTNRYRKLFKDAISRFVVYCNNGWSVSKTSLTKAQGKANGLLKRGKRFVNLRAERGLLWLIYRAKERQEVLSKCRAKAISIKRYGEGVLRSMRKRF